MPGAADLGFPDKGLRAQLLCWDLSEQRFSKAPLFPSHDKAVKVMSKMVQVCSRIHHSSIHGQSFGSPKTTNLVLDKGLNYPSIQLGMATSSKQYLIVSIPILSHDDIPHCPIIPHVSSIFSTVQVSPNARSTPAGQLSSCVDLRTTPDVVSELRLFRITLCWSCIPSDSMSM